MKKILLLAAALILCATLMAEAPQGISDQAFSNMGQTDRIFKETGMPFAERQTDTVTDIDGNVYTSVKIGDQWWFTQNLRTTRYSNGDVIPNFLENVEPDGFLYIIYPYVNSYEGNYVVYPYWGGSTEDDVEGISSEQEMVDTYGKLYNWYATADLRGLCPTGWRVPTDDEWHVLEGFADTQYDVGDPIWDSVPRGFDAGKQLKSCRQINSPLGGDCNTSEHPRWHSSSLHFGIDEYGFSALPGGRGDFRIVNDSLRGHFAHIGKNTFYWTASESCCCSAFDRRMAMVESVVYRLPNAKTRYYSVRCIKDPNPSATYNLNLDVNQPGAGTVSGAGDYEVGTQVSITATANADWEFVNWTGDTDYIDDPNSAATSVTMSAFEISLIANFEEERQSLPPCPGVSLATDVDGNHYNTIQVGNQCWMRDNLKTTQYSNGTPIAYPGTDNSAWENNTTGAYAWYNNNHDYKDKYGALYNWHAVNSLNGLCPVGWHIPELHDFFDLFDYLGGWSSPYGNKLKSCRQDGSPLGGECDTWEHPRWNSHHVHYGTDDLGFSGLPAGLRNADGTFFYVGLQANWWSASEWDDEGESFQLVFDQGSISGWLNSYKEGLSLRCIWSGNLPSVSTSEITNITSYSAVGGGNVLDIGWSMVIARGVVWSTDEYPTLDNNLGFTYDLSGPGEFESQISDLVANTTYYVRAYATNNEGTYYGNQVPFQTYSHLPCPGMPTIKDVDGNEYNTVLIGIQCWMRENLKTTKYHDGTPIDNPVSETDWQNNTIGAYVWYDNHIGWKDSYGALYNWHAVNNAKGLCPAGWHIPTHEEWTILTNYIGGIDSPFGNHLKTCRQVNSPLGGDCNTTAHPRWFQNSTHYGSDLHGFMGLPGGTRSFSGFGNLEFRSYWWSSSEIGTTGLVRTRELFWNAGNVGVTSNGKANGLSVRCLYDETIGSVLPNVITSPITSITDVSAIGGGNITYDGGFQVWPCGVVWSTSENPTMENNEGFTDEGIGAGEFISHLTGLYPNTTYYVKAYATNNAGTAYGEQVSFTTLIDDNHCTDMPTVTDIDGNVYNTVLIGDQCWMRENLKTTTYNDGVIIPNVADNSQWEGMTTGAFSWFNNDDEYKEPYGALYNWLAVGTAKLCPAGWHVPSDEAWQILEAYLGMNESELSVSGWRGTNEAGKLKEQGTTHWNNPNTGATNSSGFTALPAGYRTHFGTFFDIGEFGCFWTSSLYSIYGWGRNLHYSSSMVYRGYSNKNRGISVRCLIDSEHTDNYNLNLEVNPSGTGTVSGAGDYEAGTQVSITATANPGWDFVNWTGDTEHVDDANTANATVTMPAQNLVLTANFVKTGIPENLVFSNETITDGDTECFDALHTITVSNITIEAGGSATLIAGESIHLLPGTIVQQGGYLLARIAAHVDDYCGIPKAIEIDKEPVTLKEDVVSSNFQYEIRENDFFRLYPNPTDGTFTLELTNAEPEQTVTVEVYGMLGSRFFSKKLPPQRMYTLSLEGQQPGIYIIRVMHGDKVGVGRLIKR